MGIYYDYKIYGIGWELFQNDICIKRFQKSYKEKMTLEQIQEVEMEYNILTKYEKENMKYFIITSCTCSYELNSSNFFVNSYMNKSKLEEIFKSGEPSYVPSVPIPLRGTVGSLTY